MWTRRIGLRTSRLIEKEQVQDSGCETVDMALLASVLLTREAVLWTADKKLGALAERLGRAFGGSVD